MLWYVDGRWQHNITHAEFAAVVVTLTEEILGKILSAATTSTFSDTSDTHIQKAYKAGMVSGTSAGVFGPYSNLMHEQLAVMLYRAIALIEQENGKVILPQISALEGYTNERLISSWAVKAITALTVNNMSGTSANTLSPGSNATIGMG